jgi:hypothetical protein
MCLEDLQIGRRKYTRFAPVSLDGNSARRPGTVTTFTNQIQDNGDPDIILGANPLRTAIRVTMLPNMVFDTEDGHWVVNDTIVWGFPIEAGFPSIPTIPPPYYPAFVLSNNTRMVDTLTIEQFGTELFKSWLFFSSSIVAFSDFQTITVWDIQIDRETAYKSQNVGQLAG